ncbi:enoyl-CoA hydratase/isomerase family protein [Pedobacter flavus]|uniref:Enoyl-CoA hydratase/isomerase family protein n=1 Tax=Pedobacter flavus TaxID=3113906 RepID=A0ABU7H3Z6_9SPHI|nr:enoyl-CoA hydratase/isomerase family protein [Pedobacter sp. VNH31]MEE1885850.1 enoyl-CoA hydratase/isomerase family protein [Pedobacter sp. VNH31]
MEKLVNFTVNDRIAYITLNRESKKNALNPELVAQLTDAFLEASNNPTIKIIILNANGSVFSAGADLEYLQKLQVNTFEENVEDSNNLKNLFSLIYNHPKIIIAQVEGHAIAGGCGLATICDFVFAVPEAKFGYTEVKLGFIPAIVSVFLKSKLGELKAKELLFTGDLITATTAKEIGLINFIIDKNSIHQEVESFAKNICTSTSSNSLKATKRLLNSLYHPELENQLNEAVQLNAEIRSSEDFKKGVSSFLNKQQIIW